MGAMGAVVGTRDGAVMVRDAGAMGAIVGAMGVEPDFIAGPVAPRELNGTFLAAAAAAAGSFLGALPMLSRFTRLLDQTSGLEGLASAKSPNESLKAVPVDVGCNPDAAAGARTGAGAGADVAKKFAGAAGAGEGAGC